MSRKFEALEKREKLLYKREQEIIAREFKLIEIQTRLNHREKNIATVKQRRMSEQKQL